MSPFVSSTLLKNKQEIFESKIKSNSWKKNSIEFAVVSIIGTAVFGAASVIGTEWSNIWHVASRLVVVMWESFAICLPSLFIFSLVRGSKITLAELAYFMVGGLAIIGIVLLSISPITAFFMWTSNSQEIPLMMSVLAGGLGFLFGIYFIGRGLEFIRSIRRTTDPDAKSGLDVFLLWSILLIAVIAQMIRVLLT